MEDHAFYSAPCTPRPADDTTPDAPTQARGPLVEFMYKMSNEEQVQFVKLRASNSALFTGRRNSTKYAWRAILKEMGLQGKMSDCQAMRKWENMKNKYKVQFQQSRTLGAAEGPVWRWFTLMDDALHGRLATSAKVLSMATAKVQDDADFLPSRKRIRETSQMDHHINGSLQMNLTSTISKDEPLVEDLDDSWTGDLAIDDDANGLGAELESLQSISAWELREKKRKVLERERMVLEREHTGLQRELASLDRERAALERDYAALERRRAELDQKEAQLEKERAAFERERQDFQREKDRAVFGKEKQDFQKERLVSASYDCLTSLAATNGQHREKTDTEDGELSAEQLERRQKFLNLFDRLIEKF